MSPQIEASIWLEKHLYNIVRNCKKKSTCITNDVIKHTDKNNPLNKQQQQ